MSYLLPSTTYIDTGIATRASGDKIFGPGDTLERCIERTLKRGYPTHLCIADYYTEAGYDELDEMIKNSGHYDWDISQHTQSGVTISSIVHENTVRVVRGRQENRPGGILRLYGHTQIHPEVLKAPTMNYLLAELQASEYDGFIVLSSGADTRVGGTPSEELPEYLGIVDAFEINGSSWKRKKVGELKDKPGNYTFIASSGAKSPRHIGKSHSRAPIVQAPNEEDAAFLKRFVQHPEVDHQIQFTPTLQPYYLARRILRTLVTQTPIGI